VDSGTTEMTRAAKGTRNQPAAPAVDLMSLAECVERFASSTVVVLGDFVADVFESGQISRVSREAPVLILRHRTTEIVPGGGANSASNFASLGAKVVPITAVGDDETGNALIEAFRQKNVDVRGILKLPGWTTPTKKRFLAGWTHTVGQQVLRVDYEPAGDIPEAIRKKLRVLLKSALKKAHALAISDYGFGVAAPAEVRRISRLKKGIPVTLDSRYRLTEYAGSSLSAATPNEPELEALHHTRIGKDLAELERCGSATRSQMKLDSLLVTRGSDGMALFQAGEQTVHIPVHGSDQAVDVTGAGDTVLAAFTLALASGASPLEAAHIANIAGGLVVMKRGTATVSREELREAIRTMASGS
jgi:rfaE bifunctional protein kinase chain/domain